MDVTYQSWEVVLKVALQTPQHTNRLDSSVGQYQVVNFLWATQTDFIVFSIPCAFVGCMRRGVLQKKLPYQRVIPCHRPWCCQAMAWTDIHQKQHNSHSEEWHQKEYESESFPGFEHYLWKFGPCCRIRTRWVPKKAISAHYDFFRHTTAFCHLLRLLSINQNDERQRCICLIALFFFTWVKVAIETGNTNPVHRRICMWY